MNNQDHGPICQLHGMCPLSGERWATYHRLAGHPQGFAVPQKEHKLMGQLQAASGKSDA